MRSGRRPECKICGETKEDGEHMEAETIMATLRIGVRGKGRGAKIRENRWGQVGQSQRNGHCSEKKCEARLEMKCGKGVRRGKSGQEEPLCPFQNKIKFSVS